MTKEEAIYCMKSYINDDSYEHCVNCPYYAKNNLDSNVCVCESRTAHEMAIEALDRDTPKRVNIEQWIATECPNGCGHILSTHHGDGYYSIDDKPTFCPLCGQRLDWGEEEEDDEE